MLVGEKFPSSTVIGVDLSPIQPVWIPPNVEFIVDDIEDEWVYPDDFDYVHLRFIGMSIQDNPKLQQRIFQSVSQPLVPFEPSPGSHACCRNLKPGGWIEYHEIFPAPGCDDNTMPSDYALTTFYALCTEAFKKVYGFELDFVRHLPEDLQKQGFVNVQRKVFHIPIGDWARDQNMRTIGNYFCEAFMNFAMAMAARPLVEFGLEKSDIQDLVNSVRDSLRSRGIHAYVPLHVVWAQKPPV